LTPPLRSAALNSCRSTSKYGAEHLAELASAARRGEDIEIAQPDEFSIKLVVSSPAPFTPKPGERILGTGSQRTLVAGRATAGCSLNSVLTLARAHRLEIPRLC